MKIEMVVAALVSAIASLGCQAGEQADPSGRGEATVTAPASADTPHVKVWVASDGAIELDGKPADLAAVESAFKELATQQGSVWYGRDNIAADPHPNGMKVIELVVANQLPIRMSAKRDFSDAVTPGGN